LSNNNLEFICQKYRYSLESLDLTGCHSFSPAHPRLADLLRNLTTLTLSDCYLTDELLVPYARSNPGLTCLDVGWNPQLTDIAIIEVAQCCSDLITLDVSYCELLSDASLQAVGTSCHSIRTLHAASCERLTSASVLALLHLNRVTSLNLSFTRIADDALRAICTSWGSSLTLLNVGYCDNLTAAALTHLCTAIGGQLTHIDLSGTKVSDEAIASLGVRCGSLSTVNLSHCEVISDEAVGSLGTHCAGLTSIGLRYCQQLSDVSMDALACNPSIALSSLRITRCVGLSESGLLRLVKSGGCSLTQLDMSGVSSTSDETLRIVASHCPGLQTLLLADCLCVTDEGVAHLCEHCPRLTSLDLSRCEEVTDGALLLVSVCLVALTTLILSGCYRVTDEGVSEVLRLCTRMKRLAAEGCSRVSSNWGEYRER
jgi:hypothetical protein